jgi:hypothetical protein
MSQRGISAELEGPAPGHRRLAIRRRAVLAGASAMALLAGATRSGATVAPRATPTRGLPFDDGTWFDDGTGWVD